MQDWRELIRDVPGFPREGVLFKRGAYNYASLAHDEEDTLVEIERCASSALVAITNAPAGDE